MNLRLAPAQQHDPPVANGDISYYAHLEHRTNGTGLYKPGAGGYWRSRPICDFIKNRNHNYRDYCHHRKYRE